MAISPIIWGAGLASALGGALMGNALGSTSPSDRAAAEIYYQSHRDSRGAREVSQQRPDHYPLVTRNGVVPVAQLSERGLFSQARYRSVTLVESYAEFDTGPFPDEPTGPPEAPASEPITAAPAPQDLPTEAEPGHAKIIDVQAALAMR